MQGAGIAHVHLELGAAWVTEVPIFPIVVPPLSREDVIAQIGDVHLPRLGTEAELDELFDELHDRIREHLGGMREGPFLTPPAG
jgi:hypothetical protein